jgi:hypothetical protein
MHGLLSGRVTMIVADSQSDGFLAWECVGVIWIRFIAGGTVAKSPEPLGRYTGRAIAQVNLRALPTIPGRQINAGDRSTGRAAGQAVDLKL